MAITVVGGIYVERCIFPADDVIFGSGGRAAATLKSLEPDVTLVSFVGANAKPAIEYEAEHSWGVSLMQHAIPEIVSFEYYHGLSTPVIRPEILPFEEIEPVEVAGKAILQFGMLEGDAVINGEFVVFDPQNPHNPVPFGANGSSAKHLAYVLNAHEAKALTGKSDGVAAAAQILEREGADVVVIKSGAYGAKYFCDGVSGEIPAFETDRVWPIGSGDVFAAVFAHYWATERVEVKLAVSYASRAASLYCSSRSLNINVDQLTAKGFCFPEIIPKRIASDTSIYLAGPFFTMGQLWLVDQARCVLESFGCSVFSPYHVVGLGDAETVVPQDIAAIEESNVVLALCDGLDPGTIFEVGYAVKKGIPVVAFAEQASDEAMKMLVGTGCKLSRDFASSIYHTQWAALK